MTWEELKLTLQVLYSEYVGSGKIIDNTDNGNTPSALALLVNLVHNRISSYPIEFHCLRETGTFTFDGSTSYTISDTFPGLKSIYQIYGIDDNQEHPFYANSEANLIDADGWSVRGDTLYFTGYIPTGTATIQYKSKYLVKNSTGTRQQYFLADDDYSCLDADDINIIIFGVGKYINWRSDAESQNKKQEITDWYKEAFDNMILNNKMTRQIDSLL